MRARLRFHMPLSAIVLIAWTVVCFGGGRTGPAQPERLSAGVWTGSVAENYGNLPLAFEPNAGQFDPRVKFSTHGPGMTVFFTDNEAVMVLHKRLPAQRRPRGPQARSRTETEVVRMKLSGAARWAQTDSLDPLPGVSNYFIGDDPAQWRANIPNYARIRYKDVYPGVDLVAYGNPMQLEYDFVVAPGADPHRIQLVWEGVDHITLNTSGDLVLTTALGDVMQKRPHVYQQARGRRVDIAANYLVGRHGQVQFALAKYDRTLPLVIDPVTLVYATYLGGSDQSVAIAVDGAGSAYVTGFTSATDFPIKNAFQSVNKAAVAGSCGETTTYVTKFSPNGSSLVYSTYLGGSTCDDQPNGIAVDANGAAYIIGTAESTDFPVVSPIQTSCSQNAYGGVYVTKLVPAGNALAYSTYLCGGFEDAGGGIAVDNTGAAYVTGVTYSENWPVISPIQNLLPGYGAAFVAKLSPAGNSLVYSTYLGGTGYDGGTAIAVDNTGAAYVTGYAISDDFPLVNAYQGVNKNCCSGDWGKTVFVSKLTPAGNSLIYSTYLGGTGGEHPNGIAVDAGAAAFVTGITYSTDYPIRSALQSTNKNPDAGTCFVTKLATAGNSLIYSTYLGGSPAPNSPAGDTCTGIAVDGAKEAFVAGTTYSPDFPLLSPLQASLPFTNIAFVTKLSSTGTLAFSTFLGGPGDADATGIALDTAAAVYVTGSTGAESGFATSGAYQTHSTPSGGQFVAKIQGPATPSTVINTSPAGLSFIVDGTTYNATQNFTWTAGTSHTISVSSTPQSLSGVTGTRYMWASWSDSGAQAHTITASSSGATYTANFTAQYLLTVAVSPVAGGAVGENPSSSDMYYNSGTSVQLTAAANAGYSFSNWSGAISGSTNPQSVSMTGPESVTANFTAKAGPVVTITKTHSGNFTQGQTNATYTVTVSNQTGAGPTSGTVTVTDTIPTYLTLVGMSGTGWNCSGSSCTRSDSLSGGASYPVITVTVNVASNAPSSVTNQVSASGTGFATATASNATTIVPTTTTSGLYFYPVTPCRVVDTRTGGGAGGGPVMSGNTTRSFSIAGNCTIPASAQAYSLNITVVPLGPLGWLTVWPTGQTQPWVSTLNSYSGAIIANAAIVPAGTNGSISVYVSDMTHVIVDINGYFAAPGGTGGLAFYPATPCRVADTRMPTGNFGGPIMTAQLTRSFTLPSGGCGIPSTAQAYSLNMTVVPPQALNYLTTWPTGQAQPMVSTLNAMQGQIAANAAIVPAGTSGAISVFVSDASHVVIDINGYFAPPGATGALSFYPVTPCRIADTRNATGNFGGPQVGAGVTRVFPIPSSNCGLPSTAKAYSFNMTVVPMGELLYLSTWPAGQTEPVVSTLNDLQGQVVANAAIVPAGTNGAISVFVTDATHLIIDVNGYFAP